MPSPPLSQFARRAARRLRHILAGAGRVAQPHSGPSAGSNALPTAHLIDTLWCDIRGVHVQGWAHAFALPVRRLVFHCDGRSVVVSDFVSRPDLLNHYPEHACVAETGFSVYLPFPPFRPIRIEVVTDQGSADLTLDVPERLRGEPKADTEPPLGRFLAEMKERRGTVLEIGARVVGDMTQSTAGLLGPDCRFIGFDIHPAPGVDVVGDAHALTRHVPRGSVDGVLSVAVLEHLQMPWLVAAEINRALRPGGLTLHVVPQSWPVHETPNDFWRMSDEGLRVLFGPSLGFEVLEAGMAEPFTITPARRIGSWTTMPLCPAYGSAFILARKVADIAEDAVTWPASNAALADRAQSYPRHEAAVK